MYFTANLQASPRPEALRAVAAGPEKKNPCFLFLVLLCMMSTNSQKAILTNIETCLNLSYTVFFYIIIMSKIHYKLKLSEEGGNATIFSYAKCQKQFSNYFSMTENKTPRIQSYSLDLFFYSALKCLFS